MSPGPLAQQIEDLAALVVLAEVDDPASLEELGQALDELLAHRSLPAAARPGLQTAAQLCGALAAGEVELPEDSLRSLRVAATQAQRALLHGGGSASATHLRAPPRSRAPAEAASPFAPPAPERSAPSNAPVATRPPARPHCRLQRPAPACAHVEASAGRRRCAVRGVPLAAAAGPRGAGGRDPGARARRLDLAAASPPHSHHQRRGGSPGPGGPQPPLPRGRGPAQAPNAKRPVG